LSRGGASDSPDGRGRRRGGGGGVSRLARVELHHRPGGLRGWRLGGMSRPDGPGRPALIIIAHRILIGSALAFRLFFTGWQAVKSRHTGQLEHLVIAILSAIITVGMAYYLKNLKRFVGP